MDELEEEEEVDLEGYFLTEAFVACSIAATERSARVAMRWLVVIVEEWLVVVLDVVGMDGMGWDGIGSACVILFVSFGSVSWILSLVDIY